MIWDSRKKFLLLHNNQKSQRHARSRRQIHQPADRFRFQAHLRHDSQQGAADKLSEQPVRRRSGHKGREISQQRAHRGRLCRAQGDI